MITESANRYAFHIVNVVDNALAVSPYTRMDFHRVVELNVPHLLRHLFEQLLVVVLILYKEDFLPMSDARLAKFLGCFLTHCHRPGAYRPAHILATTDEAFTVHP